MTSLRFGTGLRATIPWPLIWAGERGPTAHIGLSIPAAAQPRQHRPARRSPTLASAGEAYLLGIGTQQRFDIVIRPDASHKGITDDAATHLALQHKGQAAEHLFSAPPLRPLSGQHPGCLRRGLGFSTLSRVEVGETCCAEVGAQALLCFSTLSRVEVGEATTALVYNITLEEFQYSQSSQSW